MSSNSVSQSLWERPALLAELGRNALAWANGPNSPETVGAQAAELYRNILREARQ